MRRLWNSFKIAFAMYSKIPMPRADWEKENKRYMMCFFPPDWGGDRGFLLIGWSGFPLRLQAGDILRSAGYVLIPVAVTGGIHLDGLLDTADALSSYQPRERKLEILKRFQRGGLRGPSRPAVIFWRLSGFSASLTGGRFWCWPGASCSPGP